MDNDSVLRDHAESIAEQRRKIQRLETLEAKLTSASITDATSLATPNTIIKRDGSGDFTMNALSWTAATLGSSWVAFGAPYGSPSYALDALGVVHLKGVAKSGVVGNTIFTLPVGMRPAAQLLMIVLSNLAVGTLQIFTSGAVQLTVGSNVHVSFDNITFPTN